MSITRTKAFTTSDGKTHATLEDAQKAELFAVLASGLDGEDVEKLNVVCHIFDHREAICEILKASGRKARMSKKNGKRRTAVAAVEKLAVAAAKKAGVIA